MPNDPNHDLLVLLQEREVVTAEYERRIAELDEQRNALMLAIMGMHRGVATTPRTPTTETQAAAQQQDADESQEIEAPSDLTPTIDLDDVQQGAHTSKEHAAIYMHIGQNPDATNVDREMYLYGKHDTMTSRRVRGIIQTLKKQGHIVSAGHGKWKQAARSPTPLPNDDNADLFTSSPSEEVAHAS